MKLPTETKLPPFSISEILSAHFAGPDTKLAAVGRRIKIIKLALPCVIFFSDRQKLTQNEPKRLQRLTAELRAGTCILEPSQQSWPTAVWSRIRSLRSLKQLWKFGSQHCCTQSRIMDGCSHTSLTLVLTKDVERTSLM